MLKCSFCQKPEDQIEKLVAGPDVYICNECVAIAVRLMRDRPGFFRRIRNYVARFLRPAKSGELDPALKIEILFPTKNSAGCTAPAGRGFQ